MLEMRAVIPLLVLLFSMCGAQTQRTQTEVQAESQSIGAAAAAAAAVTTQLDMSAELDEIIRGMVHNLEQTVGQLSSTLTFTQNELQNSKKMLYEMDNEMTVLQTQLDANDIEVENLKMENAAQDAELTAVKARLAASETANTLQETRLSACETEVENLKMENAAQDAELTAVRARRAASENEVENLKMANTLQETRLSACETEVENLKMDNAAQVARLSACETEVENLKMDNAAQVAELTAVKMRLAIIEIELDNLEKQPEQPKVAFSAGLTDSGYLVSGNTELNLVFTKIITNVGQAYSSTTGFFTAPVRGVYYFRFTVTDYLHSRMMKIKLFKNGEQVMFLAEYDTDGKLSYLSSGVTLQLEEGDLVNMRLPAGHSLWDDYEDNHNTFSGFLLFPL